MQIAVTPNASTWIVVPEFPPPGWERAEARRRTSGASGADPRRRAKLEELLVTLRRIERRAPLARLLHVGDGGTQGVFAVDLSLVIAYDNNSTRGTLGWRTQQGPHDATVIDLLPHVGHLLSPQAQAAEISGFVHHQREDRYDVLRSRPEVLADAKPGDADSFDAIHSVLTKYYRLVVIDSGNDESSPQWRAMIARADAIVVPTTTRPDHAESARLLLAELAGANAHAARLAENALVVVSQGSKGEPEPSQLVSTFQGIARAAVGIPYDPAMAGRPLILDSLAPPARRAWLRAGTALAMGLA